MCETEKLAFEKFFGNAKVAQTLLAMARQERIPQTILLDGPEGVGKATLARRFAAALVGGAEKIEGEIRLLIGAVENPFADPFEFRAVRIGKKVRAGADFIQTQCIYDMDRFKEWMKRVQDRGLHEKCHILAGISPLDSDRIILQCNEKTLPKVPIPEGLADRITKSEDPEGEGIRVCIEQIKELKEMKGIHGIHLMGMDSEEKFVQIVKGAGLSPRANVE